MMTTNMELRDYLIHIRNENETKNIIYHKENNISQLNAIIILRFFYPYSEATRASSSKFIAKSEKLA